MRTKRSKLLRLAIIALAATMVFAACSGAEEDAATTSVSGDGDSADSTAPAEEGGTINVATIGWTEDVAINALFSQLMEERGYEWTTTPAEVGAIYQGVADGDFDLFMDAWLPHSQADYWDQFGDEIVQLNAWYDEAPLRWAVPTSVAEEHDLSTIGDLQGKAELFDRTITGIDAGAGIMRLSKESVIPTYELGDGYTVQDSSTSAMLIALGDAVEAEEPIVVTLWEPHSAYAKWDLTNLEDPENAFGEPNQIVTLAREGFEEDFSEVAGWLKNFSIGSDPLADLELKIEEAGEGNESDAVDEWIAENRDLVDSWFEL